MHAPRAFPTTPKISRDSKLYGNRLTTAKFFTALAALLVTITIALVIGGNGGHRCCAASIGEFSSPPAAS